MIRDISGLRALKLTVLSIDAATELLDVTLLTSAGQLFSRTAVAGFTHSERLMPSIAGLLGDAGIGVEAIDLFVCARGPGSFTGLRIGMSTAKGLRFAFNRPMVAVSTLDALAYRYTTHMGPVIPVLDARKNRIYTAIYENGIRTSDYLDVAPEELGKRLPDGMCLITGISNQLAHTVAGHLGNVKVDPLCGSGIGAAHIALGTELYESGDLSSNDSGPHYLRRSDAEAQRRVG